MALLTCCDCGQQVSEYAEKCPNCGCPIDIIKQNNVKDEQSIIKGKIQNIQELQNLYDNDKITEAWDLLETIGKFDPGELYTYHTVISNNNYIIPSNLDKAVEEYRASNRARVAAMTSLKPTCPYCKSANVKKISLTGKALSIGTLGLFSKKIGKQWHCNKCNSDF